MATTYWIKIYVHLKEYGRDLEWSVILDKWDTEILQFFYTTR